MMSKDTAGDTVSDDPVFLVIVKEKPNEYVDENVKTMVKTEQISQYSLKELNTEAIIQRVEEVGEYVEFDLNVLSETNTEPDYKDLNVLSEIKTEPDYKDLNVLSEIKTEPDYNIDEYQDNNDFNGTDDKGYSPDTHFKMDEDCQTLDNVNSEPVEKIQILSSEHLYSTVQELCIHRPELYHDRTALIHALVEMMRAVKPSDLPEYYYNVIGPQQYECVKCGKVTISEPACGRHYLEKHGSRYLNCFACGVRFRSKTNLYKHEKRCMSPDASLVLKARGIYLGRKGRSRPFLQAHLPFTLKYDKFECQTCPAKFQTKQSLLAHERMHRGERPFQCDRCPRAYTSQTTFSRHMNTHNDVQYVCDNCGRVFRHRSALATHMFTHEDEKRYGCAQCPRRYCSNFALRLHVRRVHLKLPPPCACQVCPKRYPRMSLLNAHMKREHGVTLITRNMFFKRFPLLSTMEIEKAKVVLNHEIEYKIEKPGDIDMCL